MPSKIITWTTEQIKLGDLIEWEHNPVKLSDHDAEQIQISIEKFGLVLPLVANQPKTKKSTKRRLIDGHQRKTIMVLSEIANLDTNLDVRVPSRKLTNRECDELSIRLRKNTGDFDFSILVDDFKVDDLLDWGFEEQELDLDLWGIDEPEDDPGAQIDKAEELCEKWDIKTGQLWQLGEHRLICGDCTDAEVVSQLMQGEKADLCLTDPPYNLDFDYGDQVDDKKAKKDYQSFLDLFFKLWSGVSDRQIVTPGKQNIELWSGFIDVGCWYKKNAMSGAKIANLNLWEPILFYGKFDRKKRASDFFEHNVGIQDGVGGHPCPKIMTFWEDLVDHYSSSDDVIADPFLGSGTTMIACERLNRKCRAVEISAAYVAVSIQRWVDMTSGKPKLIK